MERRIRSKLTSINIILDFFFLVFLIIFFKFKFRIFTGGTQLFLMITFLIAFHFLFRCFLQDIFFRSEKYKQEYLLKKLESSDDFIEVVQKNVQKCEYFSLQLNPEKKFYAKLKKNDIVLIHVKSNNQKFLEFFQELNKKEFVEFYNLKETNDN